MTRKTKVAYTHLLKTIEQNWKLKPSSLTTDFEKGLRNALRLMYPETKMLGCWFHFCQCLRRRVRSLGLSSFLKSNAAARKVYHKLLCLPLIRSDCIEAAFEQLVVEANVFGDKFQAFLEYIRSEWIENERAESFAVFLEFHRTNNLSESYNSELNGKLQFHGCMYEFLEVIKKEEFLKSREYKIVKRGGTQMYPEKRKILIERDTYISKVQHDFANGRLNITDFFEEIIKYAELGEFVHKNLYFMLNHDFVQNRKINKNLHLIRQTR